MSEARDVYGNSVGDILTVAALLRSIAENEVDFIDAFTPKKPKYIYRRKEWDVTLVDSDLPTLLIPANPWRTNFVITLGFPLESVPEFSYGYPVPFDDVGGFQHYGIPIQNASTLPSIGFSNGSAPLGGTISIDDIYVTIPGLGLGTLRGKPRPLLPFPSVIAAFEETAQPM